jgi:coenzyme F420-0:L-glutamate ligase/coenzyme F420-1:gamma-L-glutamate ligase
MANAGIDSSNIGDGDSDTVLLLPEDPDKSALKIASAIAEICGVRPAVVVSDSFGRPWRMGVTAVAIGVAGMPALIDQRGNLDRNGRTMEVTQIAIGDSVASAANLVMGEGAEGIPAAILRGLTISKPSQGVTALLRSAEEDLFR